MHTDGLPPNFLFPPSGAGEDDLSSLDVLLAGPVGTPYAGGIWRLHLDIPPTYPQAPPTATFRTRLWHPNIDETTGAVCVETLKRDWSSTLKLRDVLVTISCLLIQPNPASALNEDAGKLANEDWEGFCRRAKIMTGIHAAVPADLVDAVKEAQTRGDEPEVKETETAVNSDVKGKGKAKEKGLKSEASGKGKEKASETITRTATDLDVENREQRGETVELSDPDSDWIPRPKKPVAATGAVLHKMKRLAEPMEVDTPAKKIAVTEKKADSDLSLRSSAPVPTTFRESFKLRESNASNSAEEEPRLELPSGFFKLQPEDLLPAPDRETQFATYLEEFSYSWHECQVVKGTEFIKNETVQHEIRNWLDSPDFAEKRQWEMDKFKKTGYNLRRYNRGDWGPRTGIFRL